MAAKITSQVALSTLGSVIKTAYEGQNDTNAFTDAEKNKLAGLADGQSTVVVPTGTNDHVAVQAAIDSLSASGGGVVQLLEGTYDMGIGFANQQIDGSTNFQVSLKFL